MSDPLEKNLGDLIRHGALPLDAERTARARQRFVDGISAPPERASWKIAAAAAALLVAAIIFWSARVDRTLVRQEPVERPASGALSFLGHGGDQNLQGSLQRVDDRMRFTARSPLPDGLEFSIRAERLEIQEENRELKSGVRSSLPGSATLRNGAFEFEWPYKGPGRVRLLVTAKDDLQTVELTRKLRELKSSEADRRWTFECCAWDEQMLGLLGRQVEKVDDLAYEVGLLVLQVQACDLQASFEAQKKAFIKEAEKLQARAEGMAASTLYPEAYRRIGYTARDLAQAMAIFTWDKDKFSGPRSYYTNGELSKTHRGDPFDLKTLRQYLHEATVVAGREFGLWVFEEFRRAGPRPILAETVQRYEIRPGLKDVSARLKQLVHELHGVDLGKLEQDLRRIP